MDNLAWNGIPDIRTLYNIIDKRAQPLNLIICLPDYKIPDFQTAQDASDGECRLKHRLEQALQCLQFNSINLIEHILPDVRFWLVPPSRTNRLHEHFQHISWQSEAAAQAENTPDKPWFAHPYTSERQKPKHILVIGAGISGAATAYILAEYGISVTVLDAGKAASAASGNRQGLLYAKISPHDTEQTELLLTGYGYTKRLLEHILPDSDTWGGNGIIHLNYNQDEYRRNHELGLQKHHVHLYRSITSAEAEKIAGIPLSAPYTEPSCGLFWQHGVWLNPPAFVHALLNHPLIRLHENTPLTDISHDGEKWIATTPNGIFSATHIIYCTGAHSSYLPETNLSSLPLRQIRGQTGLTPSTPFSEQLRCAVSGESYISPSWHGLHCYGASFIPNSSHTGWNDAEEASNRQALAHLEPSLAESLFTTNPNPQKYQGHAAMRCDSPDHLPIVGALGDIAAMQQTYAKLALDKNYRIDAPCPYLPNAYANTAHGTRGLATAPICAAAIAAEILGFPHPLSKRLRHALHPNRTVIRAIVRRQNLTP